MNLGQAITSLHDDEAELASELDAVADRHVSDADVFHHGHLMARVAREHANLLVPFAERHGGRASETGEPGRVGGVVAALRRATSHVAGRNEVSGVLLLRDLRSLHLAVSEVEVGWWVVRQGALVARDVELVDLFEQCHEESWNQLRWLKTKIKEAAPQVLAG